MSDHKSNDTLVVEPALIDVLRSVLSSQSKECVMKTLGISSNTWVKIKRGEAIRRSTGERLIQRFAGITGQG